MLDIYHNNLCKRVASRVAERLNDLRNTRKMSNVGVDTGQCSVPLPETKS